MALIALLPCVEFEKEKAEITKALAEQRIMILDMQKGFDKNFSTFSSWADDRQALARDLASI